MVSVGTLAVIILSVSNLSPSTANSNSCVVNSTCDICHDNKEQFINNTIANCTNNSTLVNESVGKNKIISLFHTVCAEIMKELKGKIGPAFTCFVGCIYAYICKCYKPKNGTPVKENEDVDDKEKTQERSKEEISSTKKKIKKYPKLRTRFEALNITWAQCCREANAIDFKNGKGKLNSNDGTQFKRFKTFRNEDVKSRFRKWLYSKIKKKQKLHIALQCARDNQELIKEQAKMINVPLLDFIGYTSANEPKVPRIDIKRMVSFLDESIQRYKNEGRELGQHMERSLYEDIIKKWAFRRKTQIPVLIEWLIKHTTGDLTSILDIFEYRISC